MTTAPPAPVDTPERAWKVAGLRQLHQNRLHMFGALFAKRPVLVVGRTRQCDIRVLRDPSVSRRHCTLYRADADRYFLRPADPAKIVSVSPAGDYGTRRDAAWIVLDIGMHIWLGNSILVPVDEHGEAPVTARRYSEYIRGHLRLYGSAQGAHEHAGIPRRVLQKYADRNTGDGDR